VKRRISHTLPVAASDRRRVARSRGIVYGMCTPLMARATTRRWISEVPSLLTVVAVFELRRWDAAVILEEPSLVEPSTDPRVASSASALSKLSRREPALFTTPLTASHSV
jgi:hypothetical protein